MQTRGNGVLIVALFCGVVAGSGTAQETPRNFPRFNFNVGGGFGIGRGATGSLVGNSFQATAGGGLNYNKMFGFSGEYMYYNLAFRPNVAQTQSLNQASGSLNAFSLNAIVRPPVHLDRYSVYGIFGVGFYQRNTYSSTGLLQPGTLCQPAWVLWWDINCITEPNGNRYVPASPPQSLGNFTKVAGGYNWGGGLTFRLQRWHDAKAYAEFRYHKAYFSDVESVVWPVTVGLRW